MTYNSRSSDHAGDSSGRPEAEPAQAAGTRERQLHGLSLLSLFLHSTATTQEMMSMLLEQAPAVTGFRVGMAATHEAGAGSSNWQRLSSQRPFVARELARPGPPGHGSARRDHGHTGKAGRRGRVGGGLQRQKAKILRLHGLPATIQQIPA